MFWLSWYIMYIGCVKFRFLLVLDHLRIKFWPLAWRTEVWWIRLPSDNLNNLEFFHYLHKITLAFFLSPFRYRHYFSLSNSTSILKDRLTSAVSMWSNLGNENWHDCVFWFCFFLYCHRASYSNGPQCSQNDCVVSACIEKTCLFVFYCYIVLILLVGTVFLRVVKGTFK